MGYDKSQVLCTYEDSYVYSRISNYFDVNDPTIFTGSNDYQNYFTPKRYYLPHPICLDRWDLREESLYRLITVYEEDDDSEYDYKTSYEVTKIKSNKFNGDVKMELGLGSTNNGTNVNGKVNNDYSIEVSNQNTTKTVKEETVKRKMGSDCLGTAKIYFYEPIIEGKITRNIGLFGINMNYYNVKTYTCGSLSFGLNVE